MPPAPTPHPLHLSPPSLSLASGPSSESLSLPAAFTLAPVAAMAGAVAGKFSSARVVTEGTLDILLNLLMRGAMVGFRV